MPTTPAADLRPDAPPSAAGAARRDDRGGSCNDGASSRATGTPAPSVGVDDRLAREFPVLAEVPELGQVLAAARAVDRLVAQLLSGLLTLTEHDLAEAATGVAIDQWLAVAVGRTHADRRMLLTACEVLRRLPTLRAAFLVDATVSWAQVRAVVLRVVRTPRHLDDGIDQAVADALRPGGAPTDPDDLVHVVGMAVTAQESAAAPSPEPAREPEEFLALQPRLDGTGGQVFGDFGAVNFATLDAALAPPSPTDHDRGRDGDPADADTGLDPAGAPADGGRGTARPGRWDHAGVGRARATRLIDLLTGTAVDTDGGGRAANRPQLLIRVDLSTLLDRDQLPGDLLTTLTGGRMWADAGTIRRLVHERGADLRTVVLDDTGAVLGVGRRTRVAPDWLADAVLAGHSTCSAPTCRTSARVCDLDHARPWWPPDGGAGGHTDVANLAPVCAHHNRSKEREGWRAEQSTDGTRTWYHPRSGLTVRTLPQALPPTVRRDLAASAARSRPPPRSHRPRSDQLGADGPDPPDADRSDPLPF